MARTLRPLALLALAASLTACSDDLPRPTESTIAPPRRSTQVLDGPIDLPYGINVGTFGLGVEEPDPSHSTAYGNALRVSQAGIRWVRLDFYWSGIQSGGRYAFDSHREDYQVQRARDNNLRVLGTLYGIPAWEDTTWQSDPAAWQTFLSDWERYVQWVVARYPDITHWSIWNEPNTPEFWPGTEAQYIELIRRAAPIIHGAGKKVVAPESAHFGDYLGFIGRVMNSVGSDVDVVSVHVYSNKVQGPGGLEEAMYNVALRTPVNAAWRWPIWLTEFGPLACDPSYAGTCGTPPNTFDDGFQAGHLQQTMDAMAGARTPFWERTFYWHLFDEWIDRPDGSLESLLDRGLLAGEREGRLYHDPSRVTPRQAYFQYQAETSTRFAGQNIGYRAHVAYNGWQPEVWNGRLAGMLEQTQSVGWATPELQAIQIRLNNVPGAGVQYQAKPRGQAWQQAVSDGALAGSVGQGIPLEGIRVSLINPPANRRVCYRVYRSNGAWQAAVCDGQLAGMSGGTAGVDPTIQAIQIWLEESPSDPNECVPSPPSFSCAV